MTSTQELTLTGTALENTDSCDFVSPQVSVDSIPQRETQETEAPQTYFLQQASPAVQNLVPQSSERGSSYTIRLDTVGSFLKPQPHILITETSGGHNVAEVKFQIRSYDATIIYKSTGTCQKIALQNPQDQTFDCLINGKPHQWRPLGPSQSVLELTEEANKRVALFVYAEGVAQRTGSIPGNPKPYQGYKIGEMHVMEHFLREPTALQHTLFSAVVVVEQVKRRATGIVSGVRPSSSTAYTPGRRRSRQEVAREG